MIKLNVILPILAFFVVVSCTNPSLIRYEKTEKSFRQNNFSGLIESIKEDKDNLYSDNDAVLRNIDLGVLYHYNKNFDSSNVYLLRAQNLLEELYTKSISNETVSLLTNDNLRPYRSYRYEKVLLHLFAELNFLALDEYDEALVEARKAQLLFDEWNENNNKKYSDDGFFNFITALIYFTQNEVDNAAISIYNSLLAYKNNKQKAPGLVRNVAFDIFRRANRPDDLEKFKLKDPETGESDQYLYVIEYGGRIPHLDEVVLSGTYIKDGLLSVSGKDKYGNFHRNVIPAPALTKKHYSSSNFKSKNRETESGQTFHLKVSLPIKAKNKSHTTFFTAKIDSNSFTSESFSDLGNKVSQNLEDNKTTVLTRTALRVLLRTIMAESIKNKTKTKEPFVNLALSLLTDLTSDQLEQADLRMGIFFPDKIHFSRIPVHPGEHILLLQARNSFGNTIKKEQKRLKIENGKSKFVFFHSFQ